MNRLFALSVAALLPLIQSPTDRIRSEIKDHGKAMADLAYLSDEIGARLTGSESLAKAQEWAAAKMKEYGAENVHLEAYNFPSRWVRGNDDYCRLLTQNGRQMEVHAMAWNPATKGLIRAEVAGLFGPSDELLRHIDKFKGKIVVLGQVRPPKDGSDATKSERDMYAALGKQAVAILGSFEHQDGRFTMYGSPYDSYFRDFLPSWPRLPFGFLTSENREMLGRLLRKGEKMTMELRLGGKITMAPVQEHNVVGEIRGTEKPDEVVIVGGHLDSWDLGTGTTDNGTGAVATLETLRAFHTLGLRPRRTIRFVLFSGEEQGVLGSEAYVKAHAAELGKIQSVLIDDVGAGKPTGFTVQGHGEWLPFIKKAMEPLADIGADKVQVDRHWDSDQDPFVEKGVPGFFLDRDIKDYFESTHHSQTDMFDHVKPAEYLPGIEALAVVAWQMANTLDRIPHIAPGHLVGTDK